MILDQEQKLITTLSTGGVAVIPTDTLYGLVGKAELEETVERIYRIKDRNHTKPFIILISSIKDLEKFDIKISPETETILAKIWPAEVSFILDCKENKFQYLHRGTEALAFRWPKNENLCSLLSITGPLVAPSANPEGQLPATTPEEAKKYFGDKVDFYFESKEVLTGEPSTLVAIENNKLIIKRQGKITIPTN